MKLAIEVLARLFGYVAWLLFLSAFVTMPIVNATYGGAWWWFALAGVAFILTVPAGCIGLWVLLDPPPR